MAVSESLIKSTGRRVTAKTNQSDCPLMKLYLKKEASLSSNAKQTLSRPVSHLFNGNALIFNVYTAYMSIICQIYAVHNYTSYIEKHP